jgi:hypothetical protein
MASPLCRIVLTPVRFPPMPTACTTKRVPLDGGLRPPDRAIRDRRDEDGWFLAAAPNSGGVWISSESVCRLEFRQVSGATDGR